MAKVKNPEATEDSLWRYKGVTMAGVPRYRTLNGEIILVEPNGDGTAKLSIYNPSKMVKSFTGYTRLIEPSTQLLVQRYKISNFNRKSLWEPLQT